MVASLWLWLLLHLAQGWKKEAIEQKCLSQDGSLAKEAWLAMHASPPRA